MTMVPTDLFSLTFLRKKLSRSGRNARRPSKSVYTYCLGDHSCPASISYVPLIAPSTTLSRIKFLSSIADTFIYVVSKV